MNIELSIDAYEDRIILLLRGDSDSQAYWLTRRQCIGIITACQAKSTQAPSSLKQTTVSTEQVKPKVAMKTHPKMAKIALQQGVNEVQITVITKYHPPIVIMLKPDDQVKMKCNLQVLAKRLQWNIKSLDECALTHDLLRSEKMSLH